jgi:hypothetical protein
MSLGLSLAMSTGHSPPLHWVHASPHWPQLAVSVVRSTQAPLQAVWPGTLHTQALLAWQAPLSQTRGLAQAPPSQHGSEMLPHAGVGPASEPLPRVPASSPPSSGPVSPSEGLVVETSNVASGDDVKAVTCCSR